MKGKTHTHTHTERKLSGVFSLGASNRSTTRDWTLFSVLFPNDWDFFEQCPINESIDTQNEKRSKIWVHNSVAPRSIKWTMMPQWAWIMGIWWAMFVQLSLSSESRIIYYFCSYCYNVVKLVAQDMCIGYWIKVNNAGILYTADRV